MPSRREPAVEELRALAHPVRLRILRLCLDRARTNQELATRLDMAPGTVLRHVRQLLATGLIVAEEPRRGARGVTERPYRATRRSLNLSLDTSAPELVHRAGLALVDAYRAELAEAPADTRAEGVRRIVWLTPERERELLERVRALVEEYGGPDGDGPDADGTGADGTGADGPDAGEAPAARPYSMLWSMHPQPDEP